MTCYEPVRANFLAYPVYMAQSLEKVTKSEEVTSTVN